MVSFIQFKIFYFMCMMVLRVCIYVHHMLAWCLSSPGEEVKIPGTGVEIVISCHEGIGIELGPLEEQCRRCP